MVFSLDFIIIPPVSLTHTVYPHTYQILLGTIQHWLHTCNSPVGLGRETFSLDWVPVLWLPNSDFKWLIYFTHTHTHRRLFFSFENRSSGLYLLGALRRWQTQPASKSLHPRV